ncbi:MAG: NAD(P)-dependent oxidoreductase [Verrucomicrobia bacterium]|nr:NAD(P)-dependent oxidoreductase [Verrucomicrobiota bacterium]
MVSPSSPQPPVGLIGLGLLGSALAERLLGGGLPVLGYDLDPVRHEALVRAGGEVARDAAEVFTRCRRVLLSLPTHVEVKAVLAAAGPAARPGHVILDTTTGDPEATAALAAELAARGVSYLDATVSGSSSQLREGAAVLMVGGETEAFAACGDLLAPLGRATFHCGGAGAGARMKLVTNVVLGLNRAALAEGLALAQGLGLDARQALAVMQGGPAYSRIMDRKGERMLSGNFVPEARLSQHLKDVRLILEQGDAAGLPMTLSHAHRAILEEAEAAGLGALDNSAIIRVLTARAGATGTR